MGKDSDEQTTSHNQSKVPFFPEVSHPLRMFHIKPSVFYFQGRLTQV